MQKEIAYGLAILIGTTIGGGIFGLPYVVSKAGIMPAFFYFLVLGAAVLIVTLCFGEIILRTKQNHRLVGYAQHYLGRKGKILITISTVVGMIGALLAYLIIGGDFLEIIFPDSGLSPIHFSLIFWLVLSYFLFRGLKLIAPLELLMNVGLISIILLIFCFAFPKINIQNLTFIDFDRIFLPYGVILFSLVGWTAIPEMSELFRDHHQKKNTNKVIILGTLLVLILYIMFALAVVGVSGKNTSPDALSGLALGSTIVTLGAVFGVVAIAASFLILGLYLKNTLIYDFNLSPKKSFLTTSLPPLILFLAGLRTFIEVIGLTGTIIGAVEGVVIILIFRKAKQEGDRKPEYTLKLRPILLYLLMAIFVLGAISQLF